MTQRNGWIPQDEIHRLIAEDVDRLHRQIDRLEVTGRTAELALVGKQLLARLKEHGVLINRWIRVMQEKGDCDARGAGQEARRIPVAAG